ncbi:MAG: class II fructose-bisphosphate aldolase [Chromatiaceae bacterium]|nr:class II fructose-bisphosphate aldolase [Chromatiaceae bacterium]
MPLVDMKDMLEHAHRNRYAVGAFDLLSLGFLEAIMRGCERTRAPVILSLAESHFEHFDFDLAMAATERAARRAEIPVAIHLDHGTSLESAVRAINRGCNGVMVDASHLDFAGNVALTRHVAETAHACGVTVEGELGSAGRAEEVLASARPWRPVGHLILYNTSGVEEAGVHAMMARGREVLSKIPGVRRVATGRAVKEDAQYRCCWVIEFACGKVVDSYRDHADHVAFADELFRPIALDRLSIDYELTE